MPDEDEDRLYTGKERALLARKLDESGLSARQAADKMRISDTRLRQIINGYQPLGRGRRISVVAPEDTLANIALVLKVTPQELEDAGRGDAADALRRRLHLPPDEPTLLWAQVLAEDTEIRQWATDPFIYMPPDSILALYPDDALLGEVANRMRYGSHFAFPVTDEAGNEVPEERRNAIREVVEEAKEADPPQSSPESQSGAGA